MNKKYKSTAAVIAAMMIFSSCADKAGNDVSKTELPEQTSAFSESFIETTTETTTALVQTSASETTIASETATETPEEEHLAENYVYTPPQEVLDAKFYSEDIEAEIIYEPTGYGEDNCILPEFIVNDMCAYASQSAYQTEYDFTYESFSDRGETDDIDSAVREKLKDKDFSVRSMGYMLYDMNDDGIDDYFVSTSIPQDFMWNYYADRIYLSQADGSFVPVDWTSHYFTRCAYILKTKTNGLHDIMALHNGNYPIITYDGKSSYTKYLEFDEKHTFIESELASENILHINLNISSYDAKTGEYYAAMRFEENPYFKNNILYSSYPDGTPLTYLRDHETFPAHSLSIDGADFYVELTDEGKKLFSGTEEKYITDDDINLLEIKYIAADCEFVYSPPEEAAAAEFDGTGTLPEIRYSSADISDNILHLRINLSKRPDIERKYYTVIKLADNPYLKNNILYASYPDGTPYCYTEYSFADYDFFAELTDEGVKAFSDNEDIWELLDIPEIKYIAVI